MNKKFIALIGAITLVFGGVLLLRGAGGAEFIWNASREGTLLFPLVTIAALIDSINPCAFSVLFLTIAFLLSIGRLHKEIWKIGGAYIAGLFSVYVLIGLGILQAFHILNTPQFMAKAGAVLLIVLGIINLINHFVPKFPIKLKIPSVAHGKIARLIQKGSMPTAFALGMLVGLCEFPCTGGPYLMVLGLLHDSVSYAKGFVYLIYYNILFVLPLALIMALAGNKAVLGKVETWKKENSGRMKIWSGILMILLAVFILLV
ncbi:MAG: cytochrome c biogenesis protein CcdA [Nanoarchaeota archaeon]|nr:cytochrome c biogenesis protein CcdA [Nanoarchaeota archaeon]